jgi:hypothetical protein
VRTPAWRSSLAGGGKDEDDGALHRRGVYAPQASSAPELQLAVDPEASVHA